MISVFVICLLQQYPTVRPTAMNCNGAFAECAPTVSPTRDVSEDQKEATILGGIIVSIALLSLAFVFAGKYYDVWYPAVAKKLGWEEDIKLEEISSTHSETALVDRQDKRRAVLDSHESDIENVSFTVDGTGSATPQKSTPKKSGNHVKFAAETEMTDMKGNEATSLDQNEQQVAPASAIEIEIAANLNKEGEAESRELLFGESTRAQAESAPATTSATPSAVVASAAATPVDDESPVLAI
jgi:hypothetical protein